MKFLTSIDLSQNEIQNAIMQPLAAPPANPKIGQIYFNSIDLTLYLWTGEKWIPVPTKTSQLENDSGFITSGDIPEGAAASTTTPKMNGTAAVGTEMAFARGDHVHPKHYGAVDDPKDITTKEYVDAADNALKVKVDALWDFVCTDITSNPSAASAMTPLHTGRRWRPA